MTYNKYTHFLMYEEGEEYDTAYKPGTTRPFPAFITAKPAVEVLLRLVCSLCRRRSTIFMRRRKAQSDGGSL